MISTVSLFDLKHYLREIIISYDPNEVPRFDEDFIKPRYPDIDLLLFNDAKGSEEFMSRVNYRINSVFSEIEQNNQSLWDIHEKEEYLISLSDFIRQLKSQCHYDETTNKYQCKNVIVSEPFRNPNLHKDIKIEIEVFPRRLNGIYIEIDNKLKLLPDYDSIINKKRKSSSGNMKIEWKMQLNQLVDFYLRQMELDFIETDKDNLKVFLINNFTYKGRSLSESTINTYFDPNKENEKLPKKHKKINPTDFL